MVHSLGGPEKPTGAILDLSLGWPRPSRALLSGKGGPPVGDITIRYDPPRRGRVIPLAVHNKKAHEDVEDGGSRSKLTEGPRPKADLRPTGVNHHMLTCTLRKV